MKYILTMLALLVFNTYHNAKSADFCPRNNPNCMAAGTPQAPTLTPLAFIDFMKNQIHTTREILRQPTYSTNGILTPAGRSYLNSMIALLENAPKHYTNLTATDKNEIHAMIDNFKKEYPQ